MPNEELELQNELALVDVLTPEDELELEEELMPNGELALVEVLEELEPGEELDPEELDLMEKLKPHGELEMEGLARIEVPAEDQALDGDLEPEEEELMPEKQLALEL